MANKTTSKNQDSYNNNIDIIDNMFEYYSDVYIHDILRYKDDISLSDLSHSEWVAYLDFLNKNYILPNMDLYEDYNRLSPIINISVVAILFNIYIQACFKYKKRIALYHFSMYLGLYPTVFRRWLEEHRLNQECAFIVKNLKELDQESMSELLIDSKGNPTGKIAYLNHKHGWSTNSPAPAAVQVNINPELIGARYGGSVLPDGSKD